MAKSVSITTGKLGTVQDPREWIEADDGVISDRFGGVREGLSVKTESDAKLSCDRLVKAMDLPVVATASDHIVVKHLSGC